MPSAPRDTAPASAVSTAARTSVAGSDVRLTVTDSGVGFDAAFSQHLFEPFRQADTSLRREHGGLGLGLSIARHIATMHGGTLTGVSAGVGHGASFTLTLPADGAAARWHDRGAAPAGDPARV